MNLHRRIWDVWSEEMDDFIWRALDCPFRQTQLRKMYALEQNYESSFFPILLNCKIRCLDADFYVISKAIWKCPQWNIHCGTLSLWSLLVRPGKPVIEIVFQLHRILPQTICVYFKISRASFISHRSSSKKSSFSLSSFHQSEEIPQSICLYAL